MELTAKSYYDQMNVEDYVHITLTDEDDILDALNKLRTIYKNIMKLDYDNQRTRTNTVISGHADIENKSPLELLSEFFELQNNQPLSSMQKTFSEKIINQLWEDEQ